MEKSNGPRTEPWGTPYLMDLTLDVDAFTCTVYFLSVRNDTSRICFSGDSPYTTNFRRRSASITSKALAKSTKRAPQFFFFFFFLIIYTERHWSTRLFKAVWHEWFPLNPDWLGWSRLFLLKRARMFVYVFLRWLWERWQDINWPRV